MSANDVITYSDDNGDYELVVDPGKYTLITEKQGYITDYQEITVGNTAFSKDIWLTPIKSILHVHVLPASLIQTKIYIRVGEDNTTGNTKYSASSTAIPVDFNVADDIYTVLASRPGGYKDAYKNVTILHEEKDVVIELKFGIYTIKFFPNGGSGSMEDQVTTEDSNILTIRKNTFTHANMDIYYFAGWDTAENGGNVRYTDEQNITLTQDLKLYAVWRLGGALTIWRLRKIWEDLKKEDSKIRFGIYGYNEPSPTQPNANAGKTPIGCNLTSYKSIPRSSFSYTIRQKNGQGKFVPVTAYTNPRFTTPANLSDVVISADAKYADGTLVLDENGYVRDFSRVPNSGTITAVSSRGSLTVDMSKYSPEEIWCLIATQFQSIGGYGYSSNLSQLSPDRSTSLSFK